jgi:hypothetical protein
MRDAVQPQAAVKLPGDAGRQLRPGSLGLRHHAFLFFDPGGRPGPRRRLRRRPFFAFVLPVEMPPSNDWIAARTSCCTNSRITVTKFFCRGINSPLAGAGTREEGALQSHRDIPYVMVGFEITTSCMGSVQCDGRENGILRVKTPTLISALCIDPHQQDCIESSKPVSRTKVNCGGVCGRPRRR